MASPAEAEGRTSPTEPFVAREVAPAGPVAVVWCRQVDNEAESPGYTTVPEDFPGRRETLDLIRLVGNLTVNVADTHDYWTPGPPQALSYYPNLFLYPAYGGRYTCVGRMFLSTEDRPRLGMKTLVLDTSQLLATGEFGTSVLRWHATMAGGRGDGRKPPVPDPNLYAILGEGFLFHRGSTEPVVAIASGEWDASREVLNELIRVLPASLLMLGAVLAFPYFLPQPKTNLHELAEQIPLAVALMRIPSAEAVGDRHKKRLQSWDSAAVGFRNLTDGVPSPGRAKDSVPLVLQYVRDHNSARLTPIVQRVDLVELPKLRALVGDPERQAGKERRKEMWRIGTAMESAALLLQKSRGRHAPVSAETSKRAQEYLRATVPPTESVAPAARAGATALEAGAATPSSHPSWLAKNSDLPASAPRRAEAVPIPVGDDPSLQSTAPPSPVAPAPNPSAPAIRGPTVAAPLPTPPAPPAAGGRGVDAGWISREVEASVGRHLPGQIERAEEDLLRRLANEIESAVADEVNRRLDAVAETRLKALLAPTETRFNQMLAALDARWDEKLRGRLAAANASPPPEWRAGIEDALGLKIAAQDETQGKRLEESRLILLSKIAELERAGNAQLTGVLASTEGRLRDSIPGTVGAEIDRRLRPAIERELGDSPRGDKGLLAAKVDEMVRREVQVATERFGRSLAEADARFQERLATYQSANAPLSAKAIESLQPLLNRRIAELQETEHEAIEGLRQDLGAREAGERAALAAVLDGQLRDSANQEAGARSELEARLRQSLEARIVDAEGRRPKELRELELKLSALLEARIKEAESKSLAVVRDLETRTWLNAEKASGEYDGRLAKTLETRFAEAREAQAHANADLQVRLQSYSDQKLREAEEHLRGTTVELLARMRRDVDAAVARVPDAARLEAMVKERLTRSAEGVRAEVQLLLDSRLAEAEERVRQAEADALARFDQLERAFKDHTAELLKTEDKLRRELDGVDQKILAMSDRLLPVVRKTWLKVAELEKSPGAPGDIEPKLAQVRREFKDEVRRLDGEVADRTRDIRERMETTIAHQGKVWLTLIRQLSQLTEDRRSNQGVPFPPLAAGPIISPEEVGEADDDEEPEAPPPRRLRRAGRAGASR
ncbi:MAG TPA: hypothetical protein VGV89_01430 [Thermoplasmata archaeon]|nr:hypothetical protein [Thermoplasmata archaeon]